MAAPATITVFDNLYDSAGAPVVNARVQCTLNGREETTSGGLIGGLQQTATTDANGRFAFTVVCNDLLSPANSFYTIQTPFRVYEIAPQSANGASQQTTAVNVILNTPTALAPTTSSITGPLTISGALTVGGLGTFQAGLTITGGTLAIPAGGFSMAGPLTLTAAASRIIPGATSFSLRDTANANDNLLMTDAGVATIRGGLTVTAGVITLPVASVADEALSENVALLNESNVFTVGQSIGGTLTLTPAASLVVPGATSLALRNNANTQNNLLLTDLGVGTMRNSLSIPPSAGAALPSTSYGTLPVKLDEQSSASTASLTLTVPAGALYRTLVVDITARSDQAGNQFLQMQFNGDTTANYDSQSFTDVNATLAGVAPLIATATPRVGVIPLNTATAGAEAYFRIVIQNPDSTTLRKIWTYSGGSWASDAAAGANYEAGQGQWRNVTTAITSILLKAGAGNLANARATLYGYP